MSPLALICQAGLAGTLVLMSFPPFGFGWLMWVALAPLFLVHDRLRSPALFVFGYLLAAVPIWAIALALVASSIPMFCILAIAVPAGFAGAIVVAAALERHLTGPLKLLVFPCCAVLIEALLGSERVGVPATIALTQADHPLLIQNADIFGTAGTTFLLLLVNRCWSPLAALAAGERDEPRRNAVLWPWLGLALFLLNLGYGTWALGRFERDDARITVATVQPNIPTADYENRLLDPTAQARIDRRIRELTETAMANRPDLLIVSEGGNARYNFRIPELRRALADTARRSGAAFVVSSPDLDARGDAFNALFSLAPDGTLLGSYRKRLLTPVGESYLTPGDLQGPLPSSVGPIGAMVCFESCFPGIAGAHARAGAAFLLVSLSDASFRNSALALLHARFSVFRAVETRRYLAQAANSGPSLVVRPTGIVSASTPFLASTTLVGSIGVRTDITLFTSAPFIAPCVAALVVLWALWALVRARRVVTAPAHELAPCTPWRVAGMTVTYAVTVAALGLTSVHLATQSSPQDQGVLRNVAAFFASPPEPDRHAVEWRHLQRGPNTCGPAALSYLLDFHGINASEEDLSRTIRLEEQGTTMLDLAQAAERLGLRAWGERMNLSALASERVPVIAHLPALRHFVVVLGVDHGKVRVFDPGQGYHQFAAEDFTRLWDGAVIQVRFAPIPEIDGAAFALAGMGSTQGLARDVETLSTSRGGHQPALLHPSTDVPPPPGDASPARDSH